MTKLQDSRFTEIAPYNLASQTEVQAIAYAIGRQIAKVCAYADRARVYAAIDQLDEQALDLLAVELRAPAYGETFPIETKREIIKGTLPFYARLGTPWAVNWVIRTVFGSGQISEWFTYGGEPHHFRVEANNTGIAGDDWIRYFMRFLAPVKRLTSWLDGITISTQMPEDDPRVGGVMASATRLFIPAGT